MAFRNSILAGEELVRSGIRSENYDPGVAGWRIARDGTAELNTVVVRGELYVGRGPAFGEGQIALYDAPGVGPIEEFLDSTGGSWQVQAHDLPLGFDYHTWRVRAAGGPELDLVYNTSSGRDQADLTADRWAVNSVNNTPTDWADITAQCVLTNVNLGAGGQLVVLSRHTGRRCEISIGITLGAGGAFLPGGASVTLPAANPWDHTARNFGVFVHKWIGPAWYLDSGVRHWVGACRVSGGARVVEFFQTEAASSGVVSATAPFAWGQSDELGAYLAYDLAIDPNPGA